ncbi:hypothetical protein [Caballeronia calidae]|uniref:hypothetical protein n=1 Tax=Caballeronia calidae TaxID=1777139 RepID=UPI000AAE6E24|nr:hypothetical protein [Caballeronia calidae]
MPDNSCWTNFPCRRCFIIDKIETIDAAEIRFRTRSSMVARQAHADDGTRLDAISHRQVRVPGGALRAAGR